jgi:hypothetical protein
MTKQEFIAQIAKYVQKYAPSYDIKVYSPIIAQACLESAYGTSELATKAHNYFGLKYSSAVSEKAEYVKVGSEQNADGSYTSSTMKWCNFSSLEKGVEGYFKFLFGRAGVTRYNNLKNITDAEQYLTNIKADGYATSLQYVNNNMSVIKTWNLTQYDNIVVQKESNMGYTNSSLVNCTVKSPNHSGQRTHAIDTITPHCVVGQLTAESIGSCFVSSSKQASCNYGIGKDGKVVLVVDESNRSWCTSSNSNDQRAVTIECASDTTEPYAFNDAVYNKLIELCTDICKRNGKTKLIWLGDKTKTANYTPASNEMLLTVHRWFANKSCPGNWMYSRMGDLAEKVTAKLSGSSSSTATSNKTSSTTTAATATNKSFPAVPFTVTVLVSDLNIRATASSTGAIKGQTGKGNFTITQVSNGWGKLKSGAGWIYLENASYVTIGKTTSSASTSTITTSSAATATSKSYSVRVTASALNIRKGPGTTYAISGCIKDKGTYTIVQEQNGFGKLKSGAGWIALKYTQKV